MIRIRKAQERGHADHGWLLAKHTFSFAEYRDADHMGFRSLRVMNEDRIAPGQGFGTHPHRNMEIVTYILEGALEHKDSMGNGEVLRPGEFQRMSAGSGITHSEFNPSDTAPTHLYQIWLKPTHRDIEPGYEQKRFAEEERLNRLRLVGSPTAEEGSLLIQTDARIFLATIEKDRTVKHEIATDRHAWLQVLRGSVSFNALQLDTGDGAAISDETSLEFCATADAEVMLFDLA